MPYDHQDVSAERLARRNHMLDQRFAAGTMQHLGDLRMQPRAFARGQYDASKFLGSHKATIVSLPFQFGNQAQNNVSRREIGWGLAVSGR
jgi:hypothetical protein